MKYGESWGNFIRVVGLGNVYSAWWYQILIVLISINLVLCSVKRIGPSFGQAFSKPRAHDHEILRDARAVSVPVGPATVLSGVETNLRHKGFAVDSLDRGPVKLVAAQKGTISRIGFIVTHVAVLLVLIAGVVNGKFAYRHEKPLGIGESLDVSKVEPSARFSIRLDDFVIERTEEGRIRAFKSTLTVIENGKEVMTKVMGVNHPLTYKGVGFYQASYDERPEGIREARIYLVDGGTSAVGIDVPFGETRDVPGTDLQIRVTDYVPYFVKDLVTGEVSTRSLEPRLPAVKLEVMRLGKIVDSGWLIMEMDSHSARGELARFHFADYYPLSYSVISGIDVVRNPGTSLMFTGFGIASIGLSLSFFVPFRRIWVRISEERPGRSEVRIAGISNRQPLALKREIDGLYEIVGSARS